MSDLKRPNKFFDAPYLLSPAAEKRLDWEDVRKLAEEAKALAAKHNISVVFPTAQEQQPPGPPADFVMSFSESQLHDRDLSLRVIKRRRPCPSDHS